MNSVSVYRPVTIHLIYLIFLLVIIPSSVSRACVYKVVMFCCLRLQALVYLPLVYRDSVPGSCIRGQVAESFRLLE